MLCFFVFVFKENLLVNVQEIEESWGNSLVKFSPFVQALRNHFLLSLLNVPQEYDFYLFKNLKLQVYLTPLVLFKQASKYLTLVSKGGNKIS